METTVQQKPRRVPVRPFGKSSGQGMKVEPGGDTGSAYFVLFGTRDDPIDWLRAGEGLSSVLLTAVALGLSVEPTSEVMEVAATRQMVRVLLPGPGCPYIAVRCGHGPPAADLVEAPRRDAAEAIRGFASRPLDR